MTRDFRLLVLGGACNAFGMFGEQVVVGYLVFELTGASAWVGASLALSFAPMFVFGLAAGAVADWAERRILLRYTELAIATVLLTFAGVVALAGAALGAVLALSVVTGSARALHQVVRGAYAYDLVGGEAIVTGLGRLNLGSRIGQLLGAGAAGLAVRHGAPELAFAVLGTVHLAGAASFTFLSSSPAPAAERATIASNARELLTELARNRLLLGLVGLTAAVEVFGFSFVTILPELARERIGVGADGLGVLHASRALGGIAASLLLAAGLVAVASARAYVVTIGCFCAAMLVLAFADRLSLAVLALAAIAGLAVTTDVLSQSMMQLAVPDRMRGRAMGAWVFAIGAAPLGHLVLGALAQGLGLGPALAVHSFALLALALLAGWHLPRLARAALSRR